MSRVLSEQEQLRRKALSDLRAMGIEPYPAELYPVDTMAKDVKSNYDDQKKNFSEVCLAGRLMSRRIMGKASFAELQDASGKIQLYINRDEICPGEDKSLYNEVFKKHLDIGDLVGIKGFAFKTQVGETSIHVLEIQVLAKSLKPLPIVKTDKEGKAHDAFTDPEQRYRQRYVDLIVNPQVKDTFVKRSQIIQSMRQFFNAEGYLEVETPILQPIPGGAAARPFITHHNALNTELYLRIANELYLKRLIVGGFDGVYEFAKDFRNEGMDRTHNPEFTVLEIYVAYKDYLWMMEFTEALLEKICLDVHGTTEVMYQGEKISFKAPFQRVPILDAIKKHTGVDVSEMDEQELRQTCKDLKLEVDKTMGKAKLIDELFGELCEKHYKQPTFIIDYPVEMSPLCKKHRSNPKLTERFELMVNGKELANAYTELNDPIDQLARFQDQLKLSEKGDDEAMFIDHDFVRALEYGMPPTSGMGIGIDRLVMFLTNNTSIQEVLFFPQMRPEGSNSRTPIKDKSESEKMRPEGSNSRTPLKDKSESEKMRPEGSNSRTPLKDKSESEKMKPEGANSQSSLKEKDEIEDKALELTESEKTIFELLQKESPVELSGLKEKSGLSNKQWDKGIKGLTRQGLAKVSKVDEVLSVALVS